MNNRLSFVDVYRGLAILLMLHGHTADALLNPSEKMSLAFQIYTVFRGFTAPMFLFISGFAFSITTLKHVEDYSKFSEKFFRRIRKFLFITLLGYFLHLPYLSLRKLLTSSNFETLAQLFSSDVLQVIGISLLLMQISLFLLKDESKFARLTLYLGISIFIISPIFFMIDFSKFLPLFLSQYLNSFNGSKFPLFPWIGFILLGSYTGYRFMIGLRLNNNVEIFMRKIFRLSLLSFPLSFLLETVFESLLALNKFLIYSSLFLSVSRFSFVIIVFYLIWKLEKATKLRVNLLQILGMESLFAYVFHLMVVYGSPINPRYSFFTFFGGMLSYSYVFMLFLTLLASVFFFSLLLNRAKKNNSKLFNYLKYAIANIILLIFLANPY